MVGPNVFLLPLHLLVNKSAAMWEAGVRYMMVDHIVFLSHFLVTTSNVKRGLSVKSVKVGQNVSPFLPQRLVKTFVAMKGLSVRFMMDNQHVFLCHLLVRTSNVKMGQFVTLLMVGPSVFLFPLFPLVITSAAVKGPDVRYMVGNQHVFPCHLPVTNINVILGESVTSGMAGPHVFLFLVLFRPLPSHQLVKIWPAVQVLYVRYMVGIQNVFPPHLHVTNSIAMLGQFVISVMAGPFVSPLLPPVEMSLVM